MSTLSEREAALRRALHAAADAFEPGSDGLQLIQSRLGRPRPLAVAWAEAAWLDLRLWAPAGLQAVLDRLASGARLAWQRFGPTPRRPGHRASRPLGWLRPLAALGVTVFIVAAGAYVAIDAQQAIFPSSASSAGSSGGGSGTGGHAKGGPGTTESHTQSPLGSGTFNPTSATTCKPKAAKPRRAASPSTSSSAPAQSSTPTVTPSTSSTDGPSPSPSDTDGGQIPYSTSSSTDAPTLAPTLAPSSSDSAPAGASSAPAGPSHAPKAKASTSPCG
jgi:hypothetical protein